MPLLGLWIDKVTGVENVPKNVPFIIAANHTSYMDHVVIISWFVHYLNRKVHFLAKKEHFDNKIKKIFHGHWGAIPLDREDKGKDALEWAIKAIRRGRIIAIHPEGTRSLNGKLQRAKTGVARIAIKSRALVLPVGLIGAFEVLPKGKYIPRLKRITMNIGHPMRFREYYGKADKLALRRITNTIMKEIAGLSNQEYREF